MRKLAVILIATFIALLIAVAVVYAGSNTGAYLNSGDSVTFEYVCDDVHEFGAWVKAFNQGSGTDRASVGFAVRMTDDEYVYYCLEMR